MSRARTPLSGPKYTALERPAFPAPSTRLPPLESTVLAMAKEVEWTPRIELATPRARSLHQTSESQICVLPRRGGIRAYRISMKSTRHRYARSSSKLSAGASRTHRRPPHAWACVAGCRRASPDESHPLPASVPSAMCVVPLLRPSVAWPIKPRRARGWRDARSAWGYIGHLLPRSS